MKNSKFLYMTAQLSGNYTQKTRSRNAKVIFVPKSRKIKHKVIIEKIHPYFKDYTSEIHPIGLQISRYTELTALYNIYKKQSNHR